MEIEAFLLCDAATDQRGKLNVLGAFYTIWSKKLPAVHPDCSIAARIRFAKTERGDHSVKIKITDQNDKAVCPKLDGRISVKPNPGYDSSTVNIILCLRKLKFKQYGKYKVDLIIDGKMKAFLPLYVTKKD